MRTSLVSSLTILVVALFVTMTEATSSQPQKKLNRFRQRAYNNKMKKRQFADNSQLLNVEQNGNILELFSTTTNFNSNRGRANSPDFDGFFGDSTTKPAGSKNDGLTITNGAPTENGGGNILGGLVGGTAPNLLGGLLGGNKNPAPPANPFAPPANNNPFAPPANNNPFAPPANNNPFAPANPFAPRPPFGNA